MSNKLGELKPEKVFKYFKEISQIPRCSGNEKNISDYLIKFAKDNKLKSIQDETLNVIIKKPGTLGYEKSPNVILQGHMDMVCEKDDNIIHDFNKEPLELEIDGDYLRAKGTTLGADNGIALAYCLALLEAEDIEHPPLEVVFTTGEEIGMRGVKKIETENLCGKILINIDSEDEGVFLASCAGAVAVQTKLNIGFENMKDNDLVYKIEISGSRSGHSGFDIDKGRGNANKLLGRILNDLKNYIDYRIININSGTKSNVIPRNSETLICIKDINNFNSDKFNEKWNLILVNELKVSEPNIRIDFNKVESFLDLKCFDKDSTEKTITFLMLVPNGVYTMSKEMDNLVESSSNLGVISTMEDFIFFESSVRSSIETKKYEIVELMRIIAKLIGAEIVLDGDYPGWEFKQDSKIREIFNKVYIETYGKEPKIDATHCGLECGVFQKKLGDIDIISFGPDIYDVHTPKERLSISSTQRTWEFLLKVLKEIESIS